MNQDEIREQIRKAAATLDGLDPAVREALTYRTNRIRMQPEMEPEADAPPLRRGTQLRAVPIEPRTPVKPSPDAVEPREGVSEGHRSTPRPKRASFPRLDLITYCEGCGHNWDHHRRGKCWTDAYGEPVHRARTQIDCRCDQGAKP
jgi:hypothetical protein